MLLLNLSLAAIPLQAQKNEVCLVPMITETVYPPLNEALTQQNWGQVTIEEQWQNRLPKFPISQALERRYYMAVKVERLDLWEGQITVPKEREPVDTWLAKVQLKFLLFDVRSQREIARKLVSGLAALPRNKAADNGRNDIQLVAVEALKSAFSDAVEQLVARIDTAPSGEPVVKESTGIEDKSREEVKILDAINRRRLIEVARKSLDLQYLTARLEKMRLRAGDHVVIQFRWGPLAPKWQYVYVAYVDDIDTRQVFLMFPNKKIRQVEVEPGKSYVFPGKSPWGVSKLTAGSLPPGKSFDRDRVFLLLAPDPVEFLEQKLAKGEKLVSFPIGEIETLLTQLRGKQYTNVWMTVEITK